jgi:mono/diheme cytochrome c family protein
MFRTRREKPWLTLVLFGIVMLLATNLVAQEEINYQGLTPGAGIELVLENCTVCHSADIILQNHMSRKAWDKTLTWMQKKQGMWELDKPDRKMILDYLAKAQGIGGKKVSSKATSRKSNPMYEFDYRPNPL